MKKLLFLTHRFPYPANKGDKIRALNILEHLSATHEVFLGCVDGDAEGEAPTSWAKERGFEVYCGSLGRSERLPRTALAALKGQPLSVGYFHHPGLASWVMDVHSRHQPDLIYAFSSAMAQYAEGRAPKSRFVMDFVDVDSIKWRQYAATRNAPASWIYSMEARRLLAHDRAIAKAADASLFVSVAERALFEALVPEASAKLHAVSNGVDTGYFTPTGKETNSQTIAFVGVMDYWPNVEAVSWFAANVFPLVRAAVPEARFQIVGSKPTPAVRALESVSGVEVTGSVPDVRPYLEQARVVVAPLRIARGIQNKVLEGMAMARPIVTTPEALEGIHAKDGAQVLVANTPDTFSAAVIRCLRDDALQAMGKRAREFVLSEFSWASQLKSLDAIVAA